MRHHVAPAKLQAAPPVVHEALRAPGRPLEPEVRGEMEARLGYDFSRVRVHTDVRAAESARSVDADAYTVGADVVFSAERYAPAAAEGRELLAHELVHVVQQEGAGRGELVVAPDDSPAEREAQAGAARLRAPRRSLQRQPAKEDADLRRRRLAAARAARRAIQRIEGALAKGYLFDFESPTASGDVFDTHNKRTEPTAARAARLRQLVADLRALVSELDHGPVPSSWFEEDIRFDRPGGRFKVYGIGGGDQDWRDTEALYLHHQVAQQPSEAAFQVPYSNVWYIVTAPIPKPVLPVPRPKKPAPKPPPQPKPEEKRAEPAPEPKPEEKHEDPALTSKTPGTPTGIYLHVPDPQGAPLVYRHLTGYEGFRGQHGVIVEVRRDEYGYFYWGRGDRKVRLPEEL